jgi:hypothetical protein
MTNPRCRRLERASWSLLYMGQKRLHEFTAWAYLYGASFVHVIGGRLNAHAARLPAAGGLELLVVRMWSATLLPHRWPGAADIINMYIAS